jgi:hypothetical protein
VDEGRGREFEAAAEIQKSQQQQKRGGEKEGRRRGEKRSAAEHVAARPRSSLAAAPFSSSPDSTSSSPSSAVKKGRERAFLFSLQASQRHSVTQSHSDGSYSTWAAYSTQLNERIFLNNNITSN